MVTDQQFKGAGFNELKNVLIEKFGKDGFEKVLSESSPEVRKLATRRVLDNEWISDKLSSDLSETADRVLGNGDGNLLRELGYLIGKANLKGIYKAFVKLSSIRSILKRSNVVWRKYYSHGFIETVKNEKGHFIFQVLQYTPSPPSCLGLLGWIDCLFEAYKIDGSVEHTKCTLLGDKVCEFELKW